MNSIKKKGEIEMRYPYIKGMIGEKLAERFISKILQEEFPNRQVVRLRNPPAVSVLGKGSWEPDMFYIVGRSMSFVKKEGKWVGIKGEEEPQKFVVEVKTGEYSHLRSNQKELVEHAKNLGIRVLLVKVQLHDINRGIITVEEL